jgi:hypothetical protein
MKYKLTIDEIEALPVPVSTFVKFCIVCEMIGCTAPIFGGEVEDYRKPAYLRFAGNITNNKEEQGFYVNITPSSGYAKLETFSIKEDSENE